MISSFFGKTKPINYIILITPLFFFYWFVNLLLFERSLGLEQLSIHLLALGSLIFGYFVLNFIVQRNKVSGQNSFPLLFFTLLLIVFYETLGDNNALFCSFFMLLALRRLISIRSLKNIKPKVFDATFWILISSFFYDWALLFLILVFMAIYIYEPKNLKNWLVPFTAIFTVGVVGYTILIVLQSDAMIWQHYRFSISYDKEYLMQWQNSAKLVLYVAGISITGFWSFLKSGNTGTGKVATMRIIAFAFLLGLILEVLKSSSTEFPIIVTFFPASVFLARYVEAIRRPNLRELFLMLAIFFPLMGFFIELIIK